MDPPNWQVGLVEAHKGSDRFCGSRRESASPTHLEVEAANAKLEG